MAFQFVDSAHIDEAARKLIRSHVMKGKNAGRKIDRPSKLSTTRREQTEDCNAFRHITSTQTIKTSDAMYTAYTEGAVSKNVFTTLLTLRLPSGIEMTPQTTKVISLFFIYVTEKIYPPCLVISTEQVNPQWMQLLFMDEATSHCTIACMEACNEFFFGKNESSTLALSHLSKTLTLINRRLAGDEALSDSTIGIVLMLIIQGQIRKEHHQAEIHYEGLRKMVTLRGGLGQLENNLPLVLKICKTDITYALQQGRPMTFPRDRMSTIKQTFQENGLDPNGLSTTLTLEYESLDSILLEVLVDVKYLTSLLNTVSPGLTMDVNTFLEIIISISSRLIAYRPLQHFKQISNIDAVLHIGLTICVVTSFLQLNGRQLLRYDLVTLRFKEVLDVSSDNVADELLLWLVIMGGIWTSDESWLIPRIRTLAERLGIYAWEEARALIRELPWIGVLHDEPGHAFWNRALRNPST